MSDTEPVCTNERGDCFGVRRVPGGRDGARYKAVPGVPSCYGTPGSGRSECLTWLATLAEKVQNGEPLARWAEQYGDAMLADQWARGSSNDRWRLYSSFSGEWFDEPPDDWRPTFSLLSTRREKSA